MRRLYEKLYSRLNFSLYPSGGVAMPERMRMTEQKQLETFAAEERKRLSEHEREFIGFKKVLADRERDLESVRATLREEQLMREKELQLEFAAREELFAEREKKLLERQRDFERQLMQRQAESESLRHHLAEEVAAREAKLQQARIELQQEKERYNEESRKRIEQTSKGYVSEALDMLDRKEKQFHRLSKVWAGLGAISLVTGMIFFSVVTYATATAMPSSVSWEFITFSVFKGLIAIALIAGLARYSFLFSNAYMREALKNADHTHAINFGKFYLQSYGAAADWSQVKEAFANWNTTGSNAFTQNMDASLDITAIEYAASLLEKIAKALPKAKATDGV